MRVLVIRSDKHTQEIKRMEFSSAVDELASIMPASIYASRMEIAADLANRHHIETLGYLYELTAVVEHQPANLGQAPEFTPDRQG